MAIGASSNDGVELVDEILSAFDIDRFSICNSGQVSLGDSLTVVTPPEQWSYAVMIPLSVAAEEIAAPVTVRVEATVRRGRIGIGFVGVDINAFLVEVERAIIDAGSFDLHLESLAAARWLVIRNTAPGGLASEVSVHTIRVFRAGEERRPRPGSVLDLVAARWGQPELCPDEANWATIPMMRRRAGYLSDVLAKYVDPRVRRHRVLSLCCGHGHFERGLLQSMNYEFCDAFDISEGALENARRLASEAGVRNINYERQDINRLRLSHPYDLAFAGGVHHLSNLEHVFAEVARRLRPGAPFLMYEYIGPNQCQPTERQLEAINACIRLLPEKYRLRVSTQRRLGVAGADEGLALLRQKWEVMGAGSEARGARHGMISGDPAFGEFFWQKYVPMTPEQWTTVDPSEAVRSQDIVPVLKQYFADVDVRYQGGSIVQFALHDLAANFYGDSREVRAILDMLIRIDDVLTAHDPDIPYTYAVIVALNPKSSATPGGA